MRRKARPPAATRRWGDPTPTRRRCPATRSLTWRNPFAYFHSVIDNPECAKADVGLDQLVPDLRKAKTTPNFSYIVPNACHDGSEVPCEPGAVAGLAAAEAFLKTVVPEIPKPRRPTRKTG